MEVVGLFGGDTVYFSNEELKRIIETKPVGGFYPYNLKEYDDDAADEYISKVVGSLAAIKNLDYKAEFEHYGSGYASYVEVFCYKKDGSSSEERNGVLEIDGIRIYICRLTPVAVIGKGRVTKHDKGGSSDFLPSQNVDVLPSGDWEEMAAGIRGVLARYHFKDLDSNYVSQPLPFEADIPTLLGDPPYKIFDALFYWED